MRYIQKMVGQPPEILDFFARQLAMRAEDENMAASSLEYGAFRPAEILPRLEREQGWLCAYTGLALDDRLQDRQPRNQTPPRRDYWFKSHVEHLKPQSQCEAELKAQGKVPGQDRGEDMDYHNMVAALEVAGTRGEWFGAVHRGNNPIFALPTQPDCESRFQYNQNGRMDGLDIPAMTTVETLLLNHKTLIDARKGTIEGFLPEDIRDDPKLLETLIQKLDSPEDGHLEEFCFVIKAIAIQELQRLRPTIIV